MKIKNIVKAVLGVTLLLALSSCADHVDLTQAGMPQSVGFLHGLWHGWIAPISWIVSLFSEDTAIYAVYNNGGWYDFGFILGVGALSRGASATVSSNSRHDDER